MKRFLFVAALAVAFTVPIALLVIQSFSGRWVYPQVLPEVWSSGPWEHFLQSSAWIAPLASSLTYSLLSLALASILCFPAARSLAYSANPRQGLETFLLAPAVVPATTTALGNHLWMTGLGWTDSLFAVVTILTFYNYPYLLRSLTAGYRLLGPHLAQAAHNLGASPSRVFWTVELPLLFPAWIAGGTIVFLGGFSDYFLVSLFGGGVVPSFATFLMPVLGGSDRSWGSVLTLVFLTLPLVLLGLLDVVTKAWFVRRKL